MSYTQNNPLSRKSSPLNDFDDLVTKLEGQGKSHESAVKIAGSVANAKMHGAGSGPTAKQKARHGMSRRPKEKPSTKPVEETRMTKGDQMPSRKSSSPLNNTGMTGLNYSKELEYMPIEDDMNRGMSRKTNTWEEDDVRRGNQAKSKGDYGHAEALFDDAHDSYNWRSGMDTHAEHGPSRKSRSERLRNRAMKRSERSGAEWGDYDYEDKRVQKMLSKASELDERSGGEMKMMMTKKLTKAKPKSGGPR